MSDDPAGSSLESFFDDLGERDEVYGAALKEVLAWQLERCRRERRITKSGMASTLGTSRTQIDRILDPGNVAVSIGMLAKTARALGKELRIELVEPGEGTSVTEA